MRQKNFLRIAALAVLVIIVATSCGSSKKANQSSHVTDSTKPFGHGASEAPCTLYDDDEYFTATGIAAGPSTQKGTLQKIALSNGQDMIRQKMQHAYKGVVKNFFESVGANKGTDVETQTIGAGDQIIIGVINETSHCCLLWSDVDAKGNMECYIGIKVSKKKVADAIADNLSKSEKAEIRQHAEDFRKEMDKEFKEFMGE